MCAKHFISKSSLPRPWRQCERVGARATSLKLSTPTSPRCLPTTTSTPTAFGISTSLGRAPKRSRSKTNVLASKRMVANAQKADSRQNVYVLVCVNAGGGHVPPFFILPGSNLCKRMTQCGLPGSNFAATKSSFLSMMLFIQFFEWFVKKIGPKRPVLVFMDTRLIGPPGRLSMLGPRASTCTPSHRIHRNFSSLWKSLCLLNSNGYWTSSWPTFNLFIHALQRQYDMVGLASNGLTRTYIVSGFEKAGISLLSRDIMMAKIVRDKAGLKATAVIQATVRPENRVVMHLRELGIDIDSAHVFCINDAMVQAFTNRASTPKGDMTGFMVACSQLPTTLHCTEESHCSENEEGVG
ncbi:hypothetical protein H257_15138 [Aphanomyces astaci]|uniref:DDE-1 domain-containing protein n=1 Tax=Aphanomyces astaci TaxID=112090 RepID=W4FQN4_APHAT|nr:hypothetical protein H257_15138 [Aphanomyces astaci]ETV68983.1 hypothetical protein H257_15138 [Aphanomyces astaci]|eukprot:XP_009841442.1 hypothetical protein H257_15138 [Aphanomyces astaci]